MMSLRSSVPFLAFVVGVCACGGSVDVVADGAGSRLGSEVGATAPEAPSPSPPSPPQAATATRAQIAGTCGNGNDFTSYVAAERGTPELVLLGKYESDSRHSFGEHPVGSTTVTVTRTSPLILTLSSYEPTEWRLDAGPGTKIQKIVLNGYHAQTIIGADGIPVEDHSGEKSFNAYAYAWPSSTGGSDTQALVKALEEKTGSKLTAFGGCYQATSFVLRDP